MSTRDSTDATRPLLASIPEETASGERPGGASESDDGKRQLGLMSAVSLILNRVVGTGIFATPSIILRASGSVGGSLGIWLLGVLVAASGTAVYVELGTGMPRSGGEKVYLEYFFPRPALLVTCTYAMYGLFIGWSSANSFVFGQYTLHAFNLPETTAHARLLGFLCLFFAFVMHSAFPAAGLRLQNALSLFKIFVLFAIALSGICYLLGIPGFHIQPGVDLPRNFESWDSVWAGSSTGLNAFVTGLYTVIWSFWGYSNANYALSEVKNPARTLRVAAPLAMAALSVAYLLVNVAYFAVVSKEDILNSGQIIAALYFRNLFGSAAERLLSIIIAASTLGNVLVVIFSHGRVIQELAREGILPYSSLLSSSKPFNTPAAGLFEQFVMSTIALIAPPPGDAYLFMLSLSSFPYAVINLIIAAGLLIRSKLALTRRWHDLEWAPPFRVWTFAAIFFCVSNVFLIIVPLVPPAPGFSGYETLPYWSHVAVGILIAVLGALYWLVRFRWLPRRGGYELVKVAVPQEDGSVRNVLQEVSLR